MPSGWGSSDCVTDRPTPYDLKSISFARSPAEDYFKSGYHSPPIYSQLPQSTVCPRPIPQRTASVTTPPLTPDSDTESEGLSPVRMQNENDALDFLMTLFPKNGLAALPYAHSVSISAPNMGASFDGVVVELPDKPKTLYVDGKSAQSVALRDRFPLLFASSDVRRRFTLWHVANTQPIDQVYECGSLLLNSRFSLHIKHNYGAFRRGEKRLQFLLCPTAERPPDQQHQLQPQHYQQQQQYQPNKWQQPVSHPAKPPVQHAYPPTSPKPPASRPQKHEVIFQLFPLVFVAYEACRTRTNSTSRMTSISPCGHRLMKQAIGWRGASRRASRLLPMEAKRERKSSRTKARTTRPSWRG
ncbi:Ornithine decarboxylase antizyme [Salix suchowensis]|nr:Ornithine decarboxylase antizyme [Salix suchowensis]